MSERYTTVKIDKKETKILFIGFIQHAQRF